MARAAAKSRRADAVLPGVNTLVRLTIGATADPDNPPLAANVPSRIEDVQRAQPRAKGSRTQLFVAVPHYPGDVDVPLPGTACTVTWVSSDGLYDLPTGFVERVVVGPVVWAWRVEVTGRAVRAQRRRYVRVPWARPVRLDVVPVVRSTPDGEGADGPDEDGGEDGGEEGDERRGTIVGTGLDLSEGGIRCTVAPPPLRMGQPVRVHLQVQDQALALDGTVVRVTTTARRPGADPVCETGIAFTEPDEYGDLLRRVLFREQLRSRRSGVE